MHFALYDILSVGAIGIVALAFLIHLFFKMKKNKCVTICNGCSGGGCSTKSFADKTPKNIEIHKA